MELYVGPSYTCSSVGRAQVASVPEVDISTDRLMVSSAARGGSPRMSDSRGIFMKTERLDALTRCRRTLEHEGFRVSPASELPRTGRGDYDLVAENAFHRIRVYILASIEIDDPGQRFRLKASAEKGETRVFVEWRVRWRGGACLPSWGKCRAGRGGCLLP